jgi:predicted nuclease with TOPRIM domain
MEPQDMSNIELARRARNELRLAHEAASAELKSWRERLKRAETKRTVFPDAYRRALDATREQRDRVVDLTQQIRIAEARLTLLEAEARS